MAEVPPKIVAKVELDETKYFWTHTEHKQTTIHTRDPIPKMRDGMVRVDTFFGLFALYDTLKASPVLGFTSTDWNTLDVYVFPSFALKLTTVLQLNLGDLEPESTQLLDTICAWVTIPSSGWAIIKHAMMQPTTDKDKELYKVISARKRPYELRKLMYVYLNTTKRLFHKIFKIFLKKGAKRSIQDRS